jgi:hypothetical protein
MMLYPLKSNFYKQKLQQQQQASKQQTNKQTTNQQTTSVKVTLPGQQSSEQTLFQTRGKVLASAPNFRQSLQLHKKPFNNRTNLRP